MDFISRAVNRLTIRTNSVGVFKFYSIGVALNRGHCIIIQGCFISNGDSLSCVTCQSFTRIFKSKNKALVGVIASYDIIAAINFLIIIVVYMNLISINVIRLMSRGICYLERAKLCNICRNRYSYLVRNRCTCFIISCFYPIIRILFIVAAL